jgi:transcriptional regulator with XRE-family HTH domain
MHIRGIKQKDLAKAAGISNAYCGMILNGVREPHDGRERLEKALAALTGGTA